MYLNVEFNELVKRRNGLLRYSDLIELGYNQRQIKKLEDMNIIERPGKGIYTHKDYLPDILKVYQIENKKLIYSHETAAYLHNLTDRFPRCFTATTESGYHLRKKDKLAIRYIKKDFFELGIDEIEDMSGNLLKIYDKERTICDIIRSKDTIELQIYAEVVQNYFNGKVNLNKLSRYAKILGINDKVSEIVTLMMKP